MDAATGPAVIRMEPRYDLPEPSESALGFLEILRMLAGEAGLGSNPDKVREWKTALDSLLEQGKPGLAAIREFLARNEDIELGWEQARTLGAPSLRAAVIDVIGRIGGAEALGLALNTLKQTADPREVGLLARALESMVPGERRAEILSASRETLAMALRGEIPDRDVGPLFEVFGNFGGSEAVADLEKAAADWPSYATAALGQLPDGAGVAALARMADGEGNHHLPALEVLAGISARSPEARNALIGLLGGDRVPAGAWPYLSQALAGDETQVADSVFQRVTQRAAPMGVRTRHVSQGNQTLFMMPTLDTLTVDQVGQQMALLDECVRAAGANPVAVEALERTREVLARRMAIAQAAAGVPPMERVSPPPDFAGDGG